MKRCPWCGKEYPDEDTVCAIDQYALDPRDPAPSAPLPALGEAETAKADDVAESDAAKLDEAIDDPPEGFRSFGRYDPFDADRLLKQFVDSGIRFQIDRVEEETPAGRGFRKIGKIEIFVHLDDQEKATKILTADWKV